MLEKAGASGGGQGLHLGSFCSSLLWEPEGHESQTQLLRPWQERQSPRTKAVLPRRQLVQHGEPGQGEAVG